MKVKYSADFMLGAVSLFHFPIAISYDVAFSLDVEHRLKSVPNIKIIKGTKTRQRLCSNRNQQCQCKFNLNRACLNHVLHDSQECVCFNYKIH